MSDSWHHARTLAARLQSELPEDANVEADFAERLERTVEHALSRRRSLRRRRRIGAGIGAGAAVCAAAAVVLLTIQPPQLAPGRQLAHKSTGATLVRGDLFRQDEGSEPNPAPIPVGDLPTARVLRSGPATVLQVAPSSRVELRHALVVVESVGKSAAFVLESGALGVTTSAAEERVVVRMNDVRVEGRNADFDVERSGSDCGQPLVRVRRGLVTVSTTSENRAIDAGSSWSDCPRLALVPSRSTGSVGVLPAPAASTSLQEQNDALAEAVTARRAGRADDALRLYGQFLKRWPNGPLSEVARADRMNLLATRDPNAARRAAQDYLRRHPTGPARDRARILTGETP